MWPAFVTLGRNWNSHRLPRMGEGSLGYVRGQVRPCSLMCGPTHTCKRQSTTPACVLGLSSSPQESTSRTGLHGDRECRVQIQTPPLSSILWPAPTQAATPTPTQNSSQAYPWASFLSLPGTVCSTYTKANQKPISGGRWGDSEVCPP